MSRSVISKTVVMFTMLVVGMLGVGCQSQPAEMAPQATDQLNSLRMQLFTAKMQVQEAANAARDLNQQPRADLTAQIQRLNTAVAALNSTKAQARSQAETYNQQTEAYFAKWDQTLKTMSEDTAERGQKRMAMAKESVERLQQDAADIRANLAPFMAEINEANKYLMTDTTKSGLDVVRPKLESAVRREGGVTKSIDKAVADIDAIRNGK